MPPGPPHEGQLLDIVTACGDVLIEHGRDRYGPVRSPLFASVLSVAGRQVPMARPPDIPGQRPGDRSYGGGALASVGLICAGLHRLTGRADLLDFAAAAAVTLRRTPFPEDAPVPAIDLGLALGLATDLFDLTGDTGYLEQARHHAGTALRHYWADGLFRGAANHPAYDSQMGVAYLIQALARLGLVEIGAGGALPADYTAR